MLRKLFSLALIFVFAITLTACGNKYRVEREGMPEGLKTKLEEQIKTGEEMLAAAEDDGAKEDALLEIAFANEQLGYFDKAISSYKEILKTSPNYFQALNNLGVIYEEVGEYETSARYYGKLLDANPSDLRVLDDTIRVLIAMEHFVDAQDTLEKFSMYNSDNMSDDMHTAISNQYEKIRQATRDYNQSKNEN